VDDEINNANNKFIDVNFPYSVADEFSMTCGSCPSQFHSAWLLLQHVQNVHRLNVYLSYDSETTATVKSEEGSSPLPVENVGSSDRTEHDNHDAEAPGDSRPGDGYNDWAANRRSVDVHSSISNDVGINSCTVWICFDYKIKVIFFVCSGFQVVDDQSNTIFSPQTSAMAFITNTCGCYCSC